MVIRVCKRHRIILTKSSQLTFSQCLTFQSLNSNTRVECEKCSRVIKKTLASQEPIVVVKFLSLNRLDTFLSTFVVAF